MEAAARPGGTNRRGLCATFSLFLDGAERPQVDEIAAEMSRRFAEPWQLEAGERKLAYHCPFAISVICLEGVPGNTDLLNLIERTLSCAEKYNAIFVYDEISDRLAKEDIHLDTMLQKCVNSGMEGFDVFFQPIVDTRSGTWRGMEALCRWQCPPKGKCSPRGVY